MNARTLVSLALLAALPGCSEYDSADVDVIVADSDNRDARHVTVGGAATVKVTPEGRSVYSGTDSVDVRAETPSIATARKTILSDTWTILGESSGVARFRVYVDGLQVDAFTFTVAPLQEGSDE